MSVRPATTPSDSHVKTPRREDPRPESNRRSGSPTHSARADHLSSSVLKRKTPDEVPASLKGRAQKATSSAAPTAARVSAVSGRSFGTSAAAAAPQKPEWILPEDMLIACYLQDPDSDSESDYQTDMTQSLCLPPKSKAPLVTNRASVAPRPQLPVDMTATVALPSQTAEVSAQEPDDELHFPPGIRIEPVGLTAAVQKAERGATASILRGWRLHQQTLSQATGSSSSSTSSNSSSTSASPQLPKQAPVSPSLFSPSSLLVTTTSSRHPSAFDQETPMGPPVSANSSIAPTARGSASSSPTTGSSSPESTLIGLAALNINDNA
jgi:hypothetical protein